MNKPASRTYSFAAGTITSSNGVLPARATVAAPETVTVGDFTGASITVGVLTPPRSLTITRALATGSYTTDPVVFTGRRGGAAQTYSYTPADADGGDTAHSTVLFDSLSTIAFPAQVNTGGSWTVGTRDVGASSGDKFIGFKLPVAEIVTIAFDEGGVLLDTLDWDTTKVDVEFKRLAAENLTAAITLFVP